MVLILIGRGKGLLNGVRCRLVCETTVVVRHCGPAHSTCIIHVKQLVG